METNSYRTIDVDEVERLVESAEESFPGWDWPHDPGGIVVTGPGAVDDWDQWERSRRAELDESDIEDCDGFDDMSEEARSAKLDSIAEEEREYGEAAQSSAEEASRLADLCVEAVKSGRYDEAYSLAQQASEFEAEYGDDPSYASLVEVFVKYFAHKNDFEIGE